MEYLILFLLFTHFVADFLFQNDWMAQNKSRDWRALLLHGGIYTGILYLGMAGFYFTSTLNPASVLVYVLLNGVIHTCIDFVTSRINFRLWCHGENHWFFVGVGADQLIHYATLILTINSVLLR